MNTKFIEKFVGRIWGSNLSQKSIHNDERLINFLDQKPQGIGRSKTQTESEENRFSKCHGFSTLYVLFEIYLLMCPLSRVQTTYQSNCCEFFCIFSTQYGPKIKYQKVG